MTNNGAESWLHIQQSKTAHNSDRSLTTVIDSTAHRPSLYDTDTMTEKTVVD